MESADDLVNSTQDTPWTRIAKRCVSDYTRATGQPLNAWLIGALAAAEDPSLVTMDPVSRGFARKAWARMRCTCQVCGKPGRVRSGHGGKVVVRCASCHLPSAFVGQLEAVLEDPKALPGQEKPFWMEHELPPLIRAALPEHCWRQTRSAGGETFRYVTEADLQAVTPWLNRLASLLKADLPDSGEDGNAED